MTGEIVYGENYFPRTVDENKLWRRLQRGGHVLLLAPRRVGKSSLLRWLEHHPKEGFIFLFSMVQSCESEHEYYKQILENLYKSEFVNNLSKLTKKGKDYTAGILQIIDGINLGEAGISFKDPDKKLSHRDLLAVLHKLDIERKLVLVVDEYPDVVDSISNLQGQAEAVSFLAGSRELCLSPELKDKTRFVFTGSIGLDTLVEKLGESGLINHLDKTNIEPFDREAAKMFVIFLRDKIGPEIKLSEDVIDLILDKVCWLMPYYIELLWVRLEDYCFKNDVFNPELIDVNNAYEDLFHRDYKSNFNHWSERLSRHTKPDRRLAKKILSELAKKGELEKVEIINISEEKKYKKADVYHLLDCLEHDGYVFSESKDKIRFTTPILQEWWNRYGK